MNNPSCINHEASRVQEENERHRGLSLDGTSGYRNMGCYDCDGEDTGCTAFMDLSKLELKVPQKYEVIK